LQRGSRGRAPRGRSGLRLQPICSCLRLIFLKITCSRLARERTAVSVRAVRLPIARTLSPLSASFRNSSSSARVHGREARFAGSDIGRPVWRAPSLKTPSMSLCIQSFPCGIASVPGMWGRGWIPFRHDHKVPKPHVSFRCAKRAGADRSESVTGSGWRLRRLIGPRRRASDMLSQHCCQSLSLDLSFPRVMEQQVLQCRMSGPLPPCAITHLRAGFRRSTSSCSSARTCP
jgi:hypothetical protein